MSSSGARVWRLRPDENWRVETVRTLEGHTAAVTGAVFSPDGRRLVTASRDDTAKVWDARNGQELLTLDQTGSFPVFSSDGRILAFADRRFPVSTVGQSIRLWRAPSLAEIDAVRDAESKGH